MTSVFISYAHPDEELKKRFLVHLAALKHEGLIDVWHDGMLKLGEPLDPAIQAELRKADLVLLLISADFINSNYCTEEEMRRAFRRAKAGRCRVVPVILRPCLWLHIPINDAGGRLGDFLATPHDGKPVTTPWPGGEDEAFTNIVTRIRGLITDDTVMRARKSRRHQQRRPRRKARRGPRVEARKLPLQAVERDVWLAEAIWRVFLGTWDLPPPAERAPIGPEENQRFYDLVTKEFRQAAFDGQLPIWAKRINSDLWEAVPQEYWKDHRISYLNVIREDPIKLSIEKVGSLTPAIEWHEFMTNRAAVGAIAKKGR